MVSINLHEKFKTNITYIFYAVLLAGILFAFYSLYLFRCYPLNEGFHITYAQLVLNGKVPYKDFYYYMTPMDIFINIFFWKLSFGSMLMFRIWMVIIRIFMMELIFALLRTKTKDNYAFLATCTGGILIAGNVADLLGDYNQTVEFICVLLAFTLTKFVHAKTIKKCNKWLFISGVIIGMGFCEKQTFIIAGTLILFPFLVLYCLKIKKIPFIKNFLIAFSGVLIPIIPIAIYLGLNGALPEMIQQILLNADSKANNIMDVIFTPVKNLLFHFDLLMVTFLTIFILAISSKSKNFKYRNLFLILSFVLSILGIYLYDRKTFCDSIRILLSPELSVFLVCLIVLYILLQHLKWHTEVPFIIFIAISFAGTLICYYLNIGNNTYKWMDSLAFNNEMIIFTICAYGILVLILFDLYKIFKSEAIDIDWLIFGLCSLISCYASVMTVANSYSYMQSRSMVFAAPICIAYTLNYKTYFQRSKEIIVFLGALILCSVIFCQKIVCAYSWWGTEEKSLYEETYPIDIKGLEGFRVSLEQKTMFEQVYKTIEDNSNFDDRILGFPGVTIFNLLTGRMNFPGKVPVYFYDVCSDSYASADAAYFVDNPPEIIVWWDIPGCMETHEAIFRQGNECGQRQIIYWLQDNLDKYTKICQVDNVFVYKLNDDKKVSYTYIEDENRSNITLETNYR